MMVKWSDMPEFLEENAGLNREPGAIIEHIPSGSVFIVFKVSHGLEIYRKGIPPLRGYENIAADDMVMILKGDIYSA